MGLRVVICLFVLGLGLEFIYTVYGIVIGAPPAQLESAVLIMWTPGFVVLTTVVILDLWHRLFGAGRE